jgi:hypothetical protein
MLQTIAVLLLSASKRVPIFWASSDDASGAFYHSTELLLVKNRPGVILRRHIQTSVPPSVLLKRNVAYNDLQIYEAAIMTSRNEGFTLSQST